MLSGLFPEDVVTAWGDPFEPSRPLFPEEEALVLRAVPKRKREFAKGRECARAAMASFGLGDAMLLAGESREPLWPTDVVGSITHTDGLCVAAVARSERYRGIGIDAEPAEPLAPDVARRVCRADELEAFPELDSLARAVVPRLVFVAKEAVYKCVFPVTRRFLGFEDVHVAISDGMFRARLLVDHAPFGMETTFEGRWRRLGRSGPVTRDSSAAHLVAAAWIGRSDGELR